MNTPTQDSPAKKVKILDTALRLMLTKGYHATTIDEICAEANVTKGSYFYYFKSKEDAAKETLKYFGELQQSLFHSSGFAQELEPWLRFHKFLDFYLLVTRNPEVPKSCLASTFAQELSQDYPELRALCEENFSMNAKPLVDILTECKEHYAPQAAFDPHSVAECFISLYQGSLILAKAKQNTTILEENVEHFRNYIRALFNKQ